MPSMSRGTLAISQAKNSQQNALGLARERAWTAESRTRLDSQENALGSSQQNALGLARERAWTAVSRTRLDSQENALGQLTMNSRLMVA